MRFQNSASFLLIVSLCMLSSWHVVVAANTTPQFRGEHGRTQVTWSMLYSTGAASSVRETIDRGYILNGGGEIVKLDALGKIVWEKIFGGSLSIQLITQTFDGNYVAVGDVTLLSGPGNYDWILHVSVLKLDPIGNVLWHKAYGGVVGTGPQFAHATSIIQTSDGGYAVLGWATLGKGQTVLGVGWLVRLDSQGTILWQKAYGAPVHNTGTGFSSIQETLDKGFIVAGQTNSFGNHEDHIWILKLDSQGNIIWQNLYGAFNPGLDSANSVKQTSDGGYIVAGLTESIGHGGDAWVLKLDASGNVQWQKAYYSNVPYIDEAVSVDLTLDGKYVIGGFYDSGVAGMLIKLDTKGNIVWQRAIATKGGGTIYGMQQTSDDGFIIAGTNSSIPAGGNWMWVAKLDSRGLCCPTIINNSPLFHVTSVNTNATITKTETVPVVTLARTLDITVSSGDLPLVVVILCRPTHGAGPGHQDTEEKLVSDDSRDQKRESVNTRLLRQEQWPEFLATLS